MNAFTRALQSIAVPGSSSIYWPYWRTMPMSGWIPYRHMVPYSAKAADQVILRVFLPSCTASTLPIRLGSDYLAYGPLRTTMPHTLGSAAELPLPRKSTHTNLERSGGSAVRDLSTSESYSTYGPYAPPC
ncbi:unnamed protein product [Microthlaspi erraticum]|uniref:Uncharacterized protein n=1 Tax=Microthlaspi erraticum TaxID=1685480 RepID=A0A6D2LE79_9BRAS|nr:unnamed protein product [Microthlaspi erraticum]CAA7058126.1 unnamed protein product [Microthlaspi erraticum]